MSVAAVDGPTPGIESNRWATSPSKQRCDSGVRTHDLLVQEVVLSDQQTHLERDLLLDLRRRLRGLRQLLELTRLQRTDHASTDARMLQPCEAVLVHARHGCGCWRVTEHRQGADAGGVVPDLAQLGKADVHQALDALAGLCLLADETHREPCRLLELGAHPGSLILGRSRVPKAASVRMSAGSLLLRCSRLLAKHLAYVGDVVGSQSTPKHT